MNRINYLKNYRKRKKEEIATKAKIKHKLYPEKRLLKSIRQRCNNPKCKDYPRYGGFIWRYKQ